MPNRVVPLSQTYEAHGITFAEVELRPPTIEEHFRIGDPVEAHSGPDGEGRFVIEHHDRYLAYLDLLVVRPGREKIAVLGLEESMAIKEAIRDFFLEARQRRSKPTS